MSKIEEPDDVASWRPAPDVGQAGAVVLEGGLWAYRYKEGADPILIPMPPV
ncbi:hypothetical protein [Rhodococcus qingshengii]|uniref:hypothetical protein n=1 Tax=Rhodococcus qingshengii TaxID=334542 RepID=UPI001A586D61|nr:hypothetical protein [Rhodococcus qingshengii]ULD38962.1 hypothetical protein JKI97_00130 [Rhodococcus qingshengii]